jgi:L,D-peptidoglycan transpeptidase YkuD (ErfK/YbiS/YcfS/YnhG family)
MSPRRLQANYKKRLLSFDGVSFFCVFGRDGVIENKTEGDWKTPIGTFSIRKIYYRSDRIIKLDTKLESIPLSKNDAWCDDPQSPQYNSFIELPFSGSYENLWREDCLYDIIIVIGYNDSPAVPNKGSAIFIHLTKENMEYTKGCLAIKKEDMINLLKKIEKDTKIEIS